MDTPFEPVLIVEDDEDLSRLLALSLKEVGLSATLATTAKAALAQLEHSRPSVVVLDHVLPDLPGTEVLRRIRKDLGPGLGVMMLTARGDEVDRVVAFELGADDYVVKPFSLRELMLRIRALARRSAHGSAAGKPTRLRWRGLELDTLRHKATADGIDLSLRPVEFRFVALLLENPGRLYSRAELLRELWDDRAGVSPRTVDTHVRRLRDALLHYHEAIETVHGVGYRLRAP